MLIGMSRLCFFIISVTPLLFDTEQFLLKIPLWMFWDMLRYLCRLFKLSVIDTFRCTKSTTSRAGLLLRSLSSWQAFEQRLWNEEERALLGWRASLMNGTDLCLLPYVIIIKYNETRVAQIYHYSSLYLLSMNLISWPWAAGSRRLNRFFVGHLPLQSESFFSLGFGTCACTTRVCKGFQFLTKLTLEGEKLTAFCWRMSRFSWQPTQQHRQSQRTSKTNSPTYFESSDSNCSQTKYFSAYLFVRYRRRMQSPSSDNNLRDGQAQIPHCRYTDPASNRLRSYKVQTQVRCHSHI